MASYRAHAWSCRAGPTSRAIPAFRCPSRVLQIHSVLSGPSVNQWFRRQLGSGDPRERRRCGRAEQPRPSRTQVGAEEKDPLFPGARMAPLAGTSQHPGRKRTSVGHPRRDVAVQRLYRDRRSTRDDRRSAARRRQVGRAGARHSPERCRSKQASNVRCWLGGEDDAGNASPLRMVRGLPSTVMIRSFPHSLLCPYAHSPSSGMQALNPGSDLTILASGEIRVGIDSRAPDPT
jgi:hypothetical protein